ncbi:class I SAM-dependent methyltransferase [Streptacidiphilus sp. PB12-B1b]|uniref:class I SAM-dependent methyltransferase n=1 Tax=Streptacidiphilus sp. PB12-B1b TaxID=2705012 RepID=UPI0015F97913|nr:class I SAM-dependent methyltransferase [Streptacidiphilus sp. PB12-B1b]QMU77373.1 class I SAM-dependent methyltransferase [Streptacidiphilus sp. PB12-B1b]
MTPPAHHHDHSPGPAHHDHHPASEADEAGLAEVLELDAEVLGAHLTELADWLARSAGPLPVRRILDLGSGTGAGTFTLLRQFEDAEVVAVDNSPYLRRRLRDRARDLGLADRVHTVAADLDADWPDFGGVDLVWASAALHHMADADRALRETAAALRPGGLLAVVELDGLPRFLPDDLGVGRPGLEARCRAALAGRHAEAVPLLGSDWGPRLSRAGFTVEAERLFAVELTQPLPPAAGRYAQAVLRRMRGALDGRLDAEDSAVLDLLIDGDGPENVLLRADLAVRTERTVWLARRPFSQ